MFLVEEFDNLSLSLEQKETLHSITMTYSKQMRTRRMIREALQRIVAAENKRLSGMQLLGNKMLGMKLARKSRSERDDENDD